MATTLEGKRGDTLNFTGTVTDSTGAAVNLSGCTLRFTAKLVATDTDAASTAIKKYTGSGVTHINEAAGTYRVTLTPADTSSLTATTVYVWDLQLTDGSSQVFTVADGTLTILPDVGITTP